MTFKRFAERPTKINNSIPLFPGSGASKKIPPEELNETLLHVVPNVWANKSYIQGRDFEINNHRETCAMFEQIIISQQ